MGNRSLTKVVSCSSGSMSKESLRELGLKTRPVFLLILVVFLR